MTLTLAPQAGKPKFEIHTDAGEIFPVVLPEMFVFSGEGKHAPTSDLVYAGEGAWATAEDCQSIQYVCTIDVAPQIYYAAIATVDPVHPDNIVNLSFNITNLSSAAWGADDCLICCLQSVEAPEFQDLSGFRTLVSNSGRITPMASLADPELTAPPYQWQLGLAVSPYASPNADRPIITRLDKEGTRAIGVQWGSAVNVTTNLRTFHCIHSNPSIGPLDPGHTKQVYGDIYLNMPLRTLFAEAAKRD